MHTRHVSLELSASNWRQICVPVGFAHAYVTLEPDCEVVHKVTAYYDPAAERGIAWDDPDLGIDWRVPSQDLTVASRDRTHPRLSALQHTFAYSHFSAAGGEL